MGLRARVLDYLLMEIQLDRDMKSPKGLCPQTIQEK